jgi:hypothetical protein
MGRLEDSTLQALERGYGVPIKPGRYWYDGVSGVWGLEGGPAEGQIHPGLRLGGPLKRDASKGRTGVIVNGRELHELDGGAAPLRDGDPGRYWARQRRRRPRTVRRVQPCRSGHRRPEAAEHALRQLWRRSIQLQHQRTGTA